MKKLLSTLLSILMIVTCISFNTGVSLYADTTLYVQPEDGINLTFTKPTTISATASENTSAITVNDGLTVDGVSYFKKSGSNYEKVTSLSEAGTYYAFVGLKKDGYYFDKDANYSGSVSGDSTGQLYYMACSNINYDEHKGTTSGTVTDNGKLAVRFSLTVSSSSSTKITTPLDFVTEGSPDITTYATKTNGVQWDNDTKTLTLDGADIDCPAITTKNNNIAISLPDHSTVNVLTDSSVKAGSSSNGGSVGIYSDYGPSLDKGHITFKGPGTLSISTGTSTDTNAGIYAGVVTIESNATVLVIAGAAPDDNSIGIFAFSNLINNGTLTAEGTGSDSFGVFSSTGSITNAGTMIAEGDYGIYTPSITVTGGSVKANGSNAAVYCRNAMSGLTVTGATETFKDGETKTLTNKSGFDYVTLTAAGSSSNTSICKIGDVEYNNITAAISAATNEETIIVLTTDTSENITVTNGKTLTLDLNGHVLKGDGTDSVIVNNGNLTIIDSNPNVEHYFTYSSSTAWSYISNPTNDQKSFAIDVDDVTFDNVTSSTSVIKVNGGCITGGNATSGGGICNNGTLAIKGGDIVGNKASADGGAICIANGKTLTMDGGQILGNYACNSGGGVTNNGGTFTMTNGSIIFNVSVNDQLTSTGGGLANYGNFTMKGGQISYNISTNGGGAYIYMCNPDSMLNQLVKIDGGKFQNNKIIRTTDHFAGGILYTKYKKACPDMIIGGDTIIDDNYSYYTSGGKTYKQESNLYCRVSSNITYPFSLGTGTDTGIGGNGVSVLTSDATIGISVWGNTIGTFTSNGSSTDLDKIKSDKDNYCVKYIDTDGNNGHLELSLVKIKTDSSITNGSISVNPQEPATGDEVTVTATPNSGYELDKITVKDANNNTVSVTNGKFTMPSNAPVTVSATFKEIVLGGTVSISGTEKYGETLTAVTSSLTGTGSGTLSYEWKRGTETISDATASTYTLTADDIGKTITVTVTSDKTTGSVTSSATASIEKADAPAAPTGLSGVACATSSNNDGKITGTTTGMEYSTSSDFSTKKDCLATETTGLNNGTYYVRLKETSTAKASSYTTINVGVYVPAPIFNDGFGTSNLTSTSYVVGKEYTVYGSTKYTFGGWYDNQLCTGNASTTFTNGVTYYAKWTSNNKTVITSELDFTNSINLPTDCGIAWDATNKVLTLNGATIDNSGISKSSGNVIAITVPDGTTIKVTNNSYIYGGNVTDNESTECTILSAGSIKFAGDNNKTLEIKCGESHYSIGVQAKNIEISSGKISIDDNNCSSPHGIIANTSLVISGGEVSVDKGAINSYGTITISGGDVLTNQGICNAGNLIISGGNVVTKGSGAIPAIESYGDINITGGNITATGTELAAAISFNGDNITIANDLVVKAGADASSASEITISGTETWKSKLSPDENAPKYVMITPISISGSDDKEVATPEAIAAAKETIVEVKEKVASFKTFNGNGAENAGSTSIKDVLGDKSYIDVELTSVAYDTIATSATATSNLVTYTFEVTPKNSSGETIANSAITSPVTFRLPVVLGGYTYANVYHDGTYIGQKTIGSDGTNSYIEISASKFSPYTYTLTNVKYVAPSGGNGGSENNNSGNTGDSTKRKVVNTSVK